MSLIFVPYLSSLFRTFICVHNFWPSFVVPCPLPPFHVCVLYLGPLFVFLIFGPCLCFIYYIQMTVRNAVNVVTGDVRVNGEVVPNSDKTSHVEVLPKGGDPMETEGRVIRFIIKFQYNARSDWLKQRALSEYRCTE